MHAPRRLGRLLALTVLATTLATGVSLSSADASGTSVAHVVSGGFAGAVTARPRALDRDVESSATHLRVVPCAATVRATVCWIR